MNTHVEFLREVARRGNAGEDLHFDVVPTLAAAGEIERLEKENGVLRRSLEMLTAALDESTTKQGS